MQRMNCVGDKINPEDTWILILEHLSVTSRRFSMNSKKGCLDIMTPRSYRTRQRITSWYSFRYGDLSPSDSLPGSDLKP
jgi:hypothetical protein